MKASISPAVFEAFLARLYEEGSSPDIVWMNPVDYHWCMMHRLSDGSFDWNGLMEYKRSKAMKELMRAGRWPFSRGPKGKLP